MQIGQKNIKYIKISLANPLKKTLERRVWMQRLEGTPADCRRGDGGRIKQLSKNWQINQGMNQINVEKMNKIYFKIK